MRAVQVVSLDGPAAMRLQEVPVPAAEHRVLVDVHVAGVSYPDVLLSRGAYQLRPDLPFTPGAEVAGVVRKAPAGSGCTAGARVAALCILGGFAETVAADPGLVFPLPDNVPFDTGAALPLNYLTVHFALVRRGALRAGETVLVHGAGGGVGTAAIQLARALGARVVAVTSSSAKAEAAVQAGAHVTVAADGFLAAVRERVGTVDLVLDPVGGDRFTDSLRALAPEGRLLVLGFTGGSIPEVKVNRLLLNNVAVVGVGFGAFWGVEPAYARQQWSELVPLVESGAIAPVVGARLPLEQAARAVASLEQRQATGKVLLTVR